MYIKTIVNMLHGKSTKRVDKEMKDWISLMSYRSCSCMKEFIDKELGGGIVSSVAGIVSSVAGIVSSVARIVGSVARFFFLFRTKSINGISRLSWKLKCLLGRFLHLTLESQSLFKQSSTKGTKVSLQDLRESRVSMWLSLQANW